MASGDSSRRERDRRNYRKKNPLAGSGISLHGDKSDSENDWAAGLRNKRKKSDNSGDYKIVGKKTQNEDNGAKTYGIYFFQWSF